MAEKNNPYIKICGMTREKDALMALELGTDAIGMLFYEKSPRYVTKEQACAISQAVEKRNPAVLKVGLFVDADDAFVRDTLASVYLDVLQFHGSESEAFCGSFGLPYWKTVRPQRAEELPDAIAGYPSAAGILVDTWHPTKAGGTGETFDWSVLDGLQVQHLILAGGLNPENIAEAVDRVDPWAVDVCSGVEKSPGIKSRELMKKFIDEVHCV